MKLPAPLVCLLCFAELASLAAAEPARARQLPAALRTWLHSVGAEIPGPIPVTIRHVR